MNLPLTFDAAPELGTLALIIVLSAFVAVALTQVVKMTWDFVRKTQGVTGQAAASNFVLRSSSIVLGAVSACLMGAGFGWWAVMAGIIGGGFGTWIVKKAKAKVA